MGEGVLRSTLVVRRDSEDDIKMRNLEVYVDGEWKADLGFGKTYEIELDPGEHELMVTNRMQKIKADLVLREGETAVFQGTNVLSKGISALIGALGIVSYHPTLRRIE